MAAALALVIGLLSSHAYGGQLKFQGGSIDNVVLYRWINTKKAKGSSYEFLYLTNSNYAKCVYTNDGNEWTLSGCSPETTGLTQNVKGLKWGGGESPESSFDCDVIYRAVMSRFSLGWVAQAAADPDFRRRFADCNFPGTKAANIFNPGYYRFVLDRIKYIHVIQEHMPSPGVRKKSLSLRDFRNKLNGFRDGIRKFCKSAPPSQRLVCRLDGDKRILRYVEDFAAKKTARDYLRGATHAHKRALKKCISNKKKCTALARKKALTKCVSNKKKCDARVRSLIEVAALDSLLGTTHAREIAFKKCKLHKSRRAAWVRKFLGHYRVTGEAMSLRSAAGMLDQCGLEDGAKQLRMLGKLEEERKVAVPGESSVAIQKGWKCTNLECEEERDARRLLAPGRKTGGKRLETYADVYARHYKPKDEHYGFNALSSSQLFERNRFDLRWLRRRYGKGGRAYYRSLALLAQGYNGGHGRVLHTKSKGICARGPANTELESRARNRKWCAHARLYASGVEKNIREFEANPEKLMAIMSLRADAKLSCYNPQVRDTRHLLSIVLEKCTYPFGIPVSFVGAIIAKETGLHLEKSTAPSITKRLRARHSNCLVGGAKERGIMQIMKGTWDMIEHRGGKGLAFESNQAFSLSKNISVGCRAIRWLDIQFHKRRAKETSGPSRDYTYLPLAQLTGKRYFPPALRRPFPRERFSNFGASRQGGKRRHLGVDIPGPEGSELIAAADLEIREAGQMRGFGNYVEGKVPGTVFNLVYAHNKENMVKVGNTVRAGDTVALIGDTGNAKGTPPHVHFEVRDTVHTLKPFLQLDPQFFFTAGDLAKLGK